MFTSKGITYIITNKLNEIFCTSFIEFFKETNLKRKNFLQCQKYIKKINYKIKNKKNYQIAKIEKPIILNTNKKLIPSGYYYFPIKNNIIRDNNFKLEYLEPLNIKQFYDFCNLEYFDSFISIPKFYDEIITYFQYNEENTLKNIFPIQNFSNNIETKNKIFLLWIFIKIIKFCIDIKLCIKDVNILYELIKFIANIFQEYLPNIFLIITNYIIKIKKILHILNNNKLINIEILNNYFCQICNKYFCSEHFYNDNWIEIFKNIPIINSNFKKLSGNNIYYRDYLNKTLNSYIYCNICNLCKINKNYEELKIKDIYYILDEFLEEDLYLIAIFFHNRIISNECIFTKMFNYKYNCNLIHLLLEIYNKYPNIYNKKYTKGLKNKNSYPLVNDLIIINEQNLNENFEKNYYNYNPNFSKKKVQRIQTSDSINFGSLPDYKPCDHFGLCDDNCPCKKRGFCERFCCCILTKKNCPYFFEGCKCKNGCKLISIYEDENKCHCVNNFRECDPKICKNCNKKNCKNMRIYYNDCKKCYYAYSTLIEGGGLFAKENIEQFDLIGIYNGEILESEELERRGVFDNFLETNYGFDLNLNYVINGKTIGNYTRFINHSGFKYENAFARIIFVRGVNKIGIFARCFIKKNEEIFFNYGKMNNVKWMENYIKKYNLKNN